MKSLYTILFSFTLILTISSQSEWQEFLSHERSIISVNGHLLIDDTLHIAYNNGLKKIIGNQKPDALLTHYPYMYQRTKITRTGINSKELLLFKAFDYDISGLGLVSLRNENGSFWGKEQFGYEEFGTDFRSVPDGIISPASQILDQVIDHHGDLVKLENGMLETTSPSPVDGFHEGLDDNFFAIKGDTLFRYSDTAILPVFFLGNYKNLLNDPYNNSLVIETEDQLTWYSYHDFTFTKSQPIAPNSRGIQFIVDGFYQLAITELGYAIYKYTSPEIPAFETIYELPFEEIIDFNISSFEVSGQDLFFIGSKNVEDFYNNIRFHYVQKRTINQPFEPVRADLSIDTFSVQQIQNVNNKNHSYTISLRNNGSIPINAFSISTQTLPIFDDNYSLIRKHFDVSIEPNETFSFTDTKNFPYNPSQISINITGVNYGLDKNNNNDEYTADVISLSNSNISKLDLEVYPNPSSEILNIKGDIDNKSKIYIYDSKGQIVNFDRLSFDKLDISQLPEGIYNLVVSTKTNTQSIPITKI
jgi:hypothetical protein